MEFLEMVNSSYAGVLSFACSFMLLVVTGIYAWLTYKNVHIASNAVELSAQPCMIVSIDECRVPARNPDWDRRQTSVTIRATNVGKDPALNVYCFCQSVLQNYDRGSEVKADHDVLHWSHVLPGETKEGSFCFEKDTFERLFEDMKLGVAANEERIRRGGREKAFPGTVIRVDTYCYNVPGKVFKTEAYQELCCLEPTCIDDLPKSHNLNEHTAPPSSLKDEWAYTSWLINPMFTPTKMNASDEAELVERIQCSYIGGRRAFPDMV